MTGDLPIGQQPVWRQVVYLLRICSFREALFVALSPIHRKKLPWQY